jgi:hypothetical protein
MIQVFHFINMVYSQICLNRKIATFSTSFPMDGSPLWLTNKSSPKNALGPQIYETQTASVSQATAVKQVASTARFPSVGKASSWPFYWTSVSTQGTVYGILGTRGDPGNATCEHMRASQPAGGGSQLRFDSVVAYY